MGLRAIAFVILLIAVVIIGGIIYDWVLSTPGADFLVGVILLIIVIIGVAAVVGFTIGAEAVLVTIVLVGPASAVGLILFYISRNIQLSLGGALVTFIAVLVGGGIFLLTRK